MHDHNPTFEWSAKINHTRIAEPGDVVDDRSTCLECSLRNLRLAGINREDGFHLSIQGFEDWPDSSDLLLNGNLGRSGAGGFAPNIEDVSSLVEETVGRGQSILQVEIFTTI